MIRPFILQLAAASLDPGTTVFWPPAVTAAACRHAEDARCAAEREPNKLSHAGRLTGPGQQGRGSLISTLALLLSVGAGSVAIAGTFGQSTGRRSPSPPGRPAAVIVGLGLQPIAGLLLAFGLLAA